MKKTFIVSLMLTLGVLYSAACTNFIVGKNASTDGSTMISYNADSWWLYGDLCHYPAAIHQKGDMRIIIDWDRQIKLGEIPEVAETYNVIGNINEYEVSIGETTFGGREECWGMEDSTSLVDYGSLMYLALQRSKSAREAIMIMTNLVEKYGYRSEGESFSVADSKEAWILELIGKGIGEKKGALWVARRIPDDCISAHANQARITTFPLEGKGHPESLSSKHINKIFNPEVTVVYKEDVIEFARKKGWFTAKDEDFSFSDVYNPLDFGGIRFCEARVWSFFRHFDAPLMDSYLSYINGETKERLPLWIKPNRKVSLLDMRLCNRDHYEGTPLDMTQGMGAGPNHSPYRRTPLTYKFNGTEYYNERPIATQQTGFTFISQLRNDLPRQFGGITWFGVDDPTVNYYTPIYCGATDVPESLDPKTANMQKFSWASAFWVNNAIGMMVYPNYSDMIGDVQNAQSELETSYETAVTAQDEKLSKLNGMALQEAINTFTLEQANLGHDTWTELYQYLMVKHCDGVLKSEKDGKFEENPRHVPHNLTRPGYTQEYIEKELVNPNPERFRLKTKEELKNRK